MSNPRSISPTTSKMHLLVMGWMSVGALFTISFPVAMWRVSQTAQFPGQSFNSLDCAGQKMTKRTVVTSEMCASLVVKPLAKK